ncbi:MAG TPA: dihydrofolate reductase family protein [Ktedonobacteraceae bacterium]
MVVINRNSFKRFAICGDVLNKAILIVHGKIGKGLEIHQWCRLNVVEAVRTLKAQPGKNIVIDGSSVLVHTLAEHDLIDEYSLHVYPVVLGSGKKLFPEGLHLHLHLIEASPLPSGVVFMRYTHE